MQERGIDVQFYSETLDGWREAITAYESCRADARASGDVSRVVAVLESCAEYMQQAGHDVRYNEIAEAIAILDKPQIVASGDVVERVAEAICGKNNRQCQIARCKEIGLSCYENRTGEAKAALAAMPQGVSEEQIKHMVDRFLGWRLPEDFRPDCGIHFDADAAKKLNPRNHRYEPTGTNLFHAGQAEAMIRYMIEGIPPTPTPDASTRKDEVALEAITPSGTNPTEGEK